MSIFQPRPEDDDLPPDDIDLLPPVPDSAPGLDAETAADKAAEMIERLAEANAELTARVDLLERRDWQPWPEPSPTVAAWADEWLIPTFHLHQLLRDWTAHPAIVSEVTALYAGYRKMASAKATGWDPLTWHSHLTSASTRIQAFRNRLGALDELASARQDHDGEQPDNFYTRF